MVLNNEDFKKLNSNLGAKVIEGEDKSLKHRMYKYGWTVIAKNSEEYPWVIIKVNNKFYCIFSFFYSL